MWVTFPATHLSLLVILSSQKPGSGIYVADMRQKEGEQKPKHEEANRSAAGQQRVKNGASADLFPFPGFSRYSSLHPFLSFTCRLSLSLIWGTISHISRW
jgi:hypothetical protein